MCGEELTFGGGWGGGVYCGEFFQVGGEMSKFLAGVGALPPSLPVGKTLSFIKIYIHHVTIIVIAIIIAFRVERIRNSCAQFFEHAVETFGAGMHHGKVCISSAFISLRYVQNIPTCCCSGKYNLIQSKIFIMSLQLLFNLQVLD